MKINKGKSICVFGVKGGTGKSTLVLNLAGMYARLNLRVLIVDFDLNGGSVALHLGKNISKTIYNFADDYNNNRFDNILSYVTKYNDNIDFIAAPKDPRQANKIDNKYVHILVEKAVFQYDVVLIDMSHSLDAISLSVLDKVDNILFNITNDLYDLKNVRSFISIFNDLGIDKYKVILNKSVNPNKNAYSNYEIKNIIKTNIDYILSEKLYLKNIDDYILNGEIITLLPSFKEKYKNDYKVLSIITNETLKESD